MPDYLLTTRKNVCIGSIVMQLFSNIFNPWLFESTNAEPIGGQLCISSFTRFSRCVPRDGIAKSSDNLHLQFSQRCQISFGDDGVESLLAAVKAKSPTFGPLTTLILAKWCL
jgi:hypothetical protein